MSGDYGYIYVFRGLKSVGLLLEVEGMTQTTKATKAAADKASKIRNELLIVVREQVLAKHCPRDTSCGRCPEIQVQKCMPYKRMAWHLNKEGIPSARGKIRKWQGNSVKNLFRKEDTKVTLGIVSLFS